LALFYSRAALGWQPESKKAVALREQSEREIARRARNAVASKQVGYPDREPPVELTSPTLARATLQTEGGVDCESLPLLGSHSAETFLATLVPMSTQADSDFVKTLRQWSKQLGAVRPRSGQ